MEQNNYKLPILLYDHECQLCTRFKDAIERLDVENKIQKISIHDKNIYPAFPQLDIKECYEKVHLLDEIGQVHKGQEVIQYLVKFFPSVSKFSWLLETEAGKKTLNFFYNAVNDLRKSQLNRCQSCKDKNHL